MYLFMPYVFFLCNNDQGKNCCGLYNCFAKVQWVIQGVRESTTIKDKIIVGGINCLVI